MTQSKVIQAVFDEAGETGRHERSSRNLIIAGIVCDDLAILRRLITRIHKGLSKRLVSIPELKAHHTPYPVTARLLNMLVKEDVEIYAVVVDKYLVNSTEDLERWYEKAYIACIDQVLQRHHTVSFRLDRRYTNKTRQQIFVDCLLIGTQKKDRSLAIAFADSGQDQAIQAADFVVWSIYRKYEFDDNRFYDILSSRITVEVRMP